MSFGSFYEQGTPSRLDGFGGQEPTDAEKREWFLDALFFRVKQHGFDLGSGVFFCGNREVKLQNDEVVVRFPYIDLKKFVDFDDASASLTENELNRIFSEQHQPGLVCELVYDQQEIISEDPEQAAVPLIVSFAFAISDRLSSVAQPPTNDSVHQQHFFKIAFVRSRETSDPYKGGDNTYQWVEVQFTSTAGAKEVRVLMPTNGDHPSIGLGQNELNVTVNMRSIPDIYDLGELDSISPTRLFFQKVSSAPSQKAIDRALLLKILIDENNDPYIAARSWFFVSFIDWLNVVEEIFAAKFDQNGSFAEEVRTFFSAEFENPSRVVISLFHFLELLNQERKKTQQRRRHGEADQL